jgi:hypothetical protein
MFGKIFEQALKGVNQFFSTERVVIIVVFLLLVWLLSQYAGSKTSVVDMMEDGGEVLMVQQEEAPMEYVQMEQLTDGSTASGNGYTTSQVANPADLLPSDENSQWSALNPNSANQGDTTMPDLLKAGYHIGLDTIGQTLRNANLQLRSDPIITKATVGPWNQSTIETDYARVPLEIGPAA